MITVINYKDEFIPSDIISSNFGLSITKDACVLSYKPDCITENSSIITDTIMELKPYSSYVILAQRNGKLFSVCNDDNSIGVLTNLSYSSLEYDKFVEYCIKNLSVYVIADLFIGGVTDNSVDIVFRNNCSITPTINIDESFSNTKINYHTETTINRNVFKMYRRKIYDMYKLVIDDKSIYNHYVFKNDDGSNIVTEPVDIELQNRDVIPITIQSHINDTIENPIMNDTLEIVCYKGYVKQKEVSVIDGSATFDYYPNGNVGNVIISFIRNEDKKIYYNYHLNLV